MVSINTNLSSLMVQNNLTNSTNGLNKAIERLSTGYKINHSSDNAANYSIANSYESKLSSYDMAASNVSMGLDLLSVAQDTISTMQDHGSRLHALITQARNGTYGAQSLQALTQEAGALISEIQRMYSNAEYNGKKLFEDFTLLFPEWMKTVKENAGNIKVQGNGFIDNIETVTPDITVESASALADAIENNNIIGIANAEVLAELASLVNTGTNCSEKTIVLTDDIDLSDYQAGSGWTAIGTTENSFQGTFNGNGHVVSNLKINKGSTNYQGLFGYASDSSVIKNVGIVDCNVKGNQHTGGLAGYSGQISNSYVTGTVSGNSYTGGLVGEAHGTINKSYTTSTVSGYYRTGGLVGSAYGSVTNSFTTGNVSGNTNVGGLIGEMTADKSVNNTYVTGDVKGTANSVGGLVGYCGARTVINHSYTTGSVTGKDNTAGIVGWTSAPVQNSYATGNVKGASKTGGLVGFSYGGISNSYATGDVSGSSFVGGIIGQSWKPSQSVTFDGIFSSGEITGTSKVGSLFGGIINTSNGTSFGTYNIKNATIIKQEINAIGHEGSASAAYESGQMETWLKNIKELKDTGLKTTLQVGIYGDDSSRITFDTTFRIDLSSILSNINSDEAYNTINDFMSTLSTKATEIGAVSNRLESSMESILVNMENVTSSLSTIKDADVATTSSQYIKMQILQQASATLLATANQSPSIALQLI